MSHKSTAKAGSKISTGAYPAENDKWQAEEDLRTLTRAKEIERDRTRMKAAKCCAREQIKSLAKVTGTQKRK